MDASCDTPNCTRLDGYSGVQCNTSISDIGKPNACINGNCMKTINGDFECQCDCGYFGTHCDMINSCLPNPCNQRTCVTSSNCIDKICDHSCLCSNGTTDPCSSSPCQNCGHCLISSNSYSCQCVSPYDGNNCDLVIDVCTPNPCLNNGNCSRYLNIHDGEYRSPCQNDGLCISSTMNCSSAICQISCICLNGTTGVYCEQQDTASCSMISCLNGGTCLVNEQTNISYCQCPSNTTGSRCETIQPVCTNATCSNSGMCFIDTSSSNNTAYCLCSQDYTGPSCQTPLLSMNNCSYKPCGYDGTCIQTSVSSYYCICSNGLTGQSCNSSLLSSCASSPCRHLSTCQQLENTNPPSYKFICPNYLTTSVCSVNTCHNGGTCRQIASTMGEYLCKTSFTVPTCNLRDSYAASPCHNGGGCTTLLIDTGTSWSAYRCVSPPGIYGRNCDRDNPCSQSSLICHNSGTCIPSNADPPIISCLCQEEFTGTRCEILKENDPCASNPCQTHGYCALSTSNKT
ncbi:unnamed protein product [Rotaria socialis]|uniref:EGF-like domain-containing protein n=2 Tax=Rotaria socialis TaxID=392032 RepID=A0A817YWX9_9BILA|nr:unnamed protein product [Rotaria socialis]